MCCETIGFRAVQGEIRTLRVKSRRKSGCPEGQISLFVVVAIDFEVNKPRIRDLRLKTPSLAVPWKTKKIGLWPWDKPTNIPQRISPMILR